MKTETASSASRAITVNGERVEVPAGASIARLLCQQGRDPETPGVAVALNGAVVRRKDWEDTELSEGDEVEVITAFQGG